ncbi:hypothetical protein TIFTF001_002083 [Ficus carica]|uniref:Ubiquitin fusion degradaton protein n=1 Tax=Ficus carica TaxID=3494 RepID=A0AA88CT09_FICCA|nr:hypothetical protein TIFTF001_002083 [Ficus carica]
MERIFMHYYRCYPITITGEHDHLEYGNKIVMPLSALDLLSSLEIEFPMMFELKNPRETDKVSHCGVIDFSSDEGEVLLPEWIMSRMNLEEGDLISLKSVSLDKGTFVKLRPHETAFVELSNPKAVLEKTLRQFSCLTVGDTIVLHYNGKKFCIDVLETKPDTKAVNIIDVDCEVDFAPALDYKEPEKEKEEEKAKATAVAEMMKAGDVGEETKFRAFVGVGRRLNGKSSSSNGESNKKEGSSSTSGEKSESESTKEVSSTTTSGGSSKNGNLVFGSSKVVNNLGERCKVKEDKKVEKVKEEENGFQPFSGKCYKLSG